MFLQVYSSRFTSHYFHNGLSSCSIKLAKQVHALSFEIVVDHCHIYSSSLSQSLQNKPPKSPHLPAYILMSCLLDSPTVGLWGECYDSLKEIKQEGKSNKTIKWSLLPILRHHLGFFLVVSKPKIVKLSFHPLSHSTCFFLLFPPVPHFYSSFLLFQLPRTSHLEFCYLWKKEPPSLQCPSQFHGHMTHFLVGF